MTITYKVGDIRPYTFDPETVRLDAGSHTDPHSGHCLQEVVSMVAGEKFSDAPKCVCPVLRNFGMTWNDGMRDERERGQLRRYIYPLVGTVGNEVAEERRARLALGWLVQVATPAWLDLAGEEGHAEELRNRPELTKSDPKTFQVVIGAYEKVMPSPTAWTTGKTNGLVQATGTVAAKGAVEKFFFSRDVMLGETAAYASTVAYYASAIAVAREKTARWEAVVAELQASAHDLYLSMIKAGPHDPKLVARVEG